MDKRQNTTPCEKEWNFDKLLKSDSETEVHFCFLYEFGREVVNYEWLAVHKNLSLGQFAIMLQNQDVLSQNFWFYAINLFTLEDPNWLKVPYFTLSPESRAAVSKSHKIFLSSLIDARCDVDRGLFERVELAIPLESSKAYLLECFEAFLDLHFPKIKNPDVSAKAHHRKQGGGSPIRYWRSQLRYLGALRLRRQLSIEEAKRESKRVLGRPLYSNASGWSEAKRKANKMIGRFKADLDSTMALLSAAPKGVTQLTWNSGQEKLTYS